MIKIFKKIFSLVRFWFHKPETEKPNRTEKIKKPNRTNQTKPN